MARASIPYDYFEKYLNTIYPRPAFESVQLKVDYGNRPIKTPVRAYDRTTGNYSANGWFVTIEYTILIGIRNDNLSAQYERRSQVVWIPDE